MSRRPEGMRHDQSWVPVRLGSEVAILRLQTRKVMRYRHTELGVGVQ